MVKIFMDKAEVNYPVYMAERDALDAYGLRAVPFNVLYGRDGREVLKELGYNNKKKKAIEEEIARLLKE